MPAARPLIRPFAGLRPRSEHAAAVAAPPYDVLSSEEARQRAAGKPCSFLHISKAEIDLPPEVDHYAPEVYARSAENLKKLIDEGILIRDTSPCYYAYRLVMGTHTQCGLIAAASVADYDSNRIRKHEFTRPDKEDDRVRQIEALNAQTGPVLLAHPDSEEAERLIAAATSGTPVADLTADDGIRHTIWRIDEAKAIERISAVIGALPSLYIADGHHRSAAASRVAAARRGQGRPDSAEYFLAVIFPARQMRIMDYNRVVRDLNGHSLDSFLQAVGERCTVTSCAGRVTAERTGTFGMYVDGRWYRLAIRPDRVPTQDPVRRLDVSVLSEQILAPILGIADLRRDTRIDFVGGIRGLGELERRVNSGEMAVAFAMHPTQMAELMSVADAGEVMPPKSTWFEPKLADGLVSHVLD
ncbi:MAG: DUF1015 domain-containing protein [Propionivibrio sp.]|uniref:DUF1015 domain-containing protein n=1 Tax=Candidatus Propionivibrio dominans TaxID=2954373 RepID=A0A9D7F5N6_9RHOO|nr:DUF1015 domain-containing protein [Candidatus Propionivibrio dominans]